MLDEMLYKHISVSNSVGSVLRYVTYFLPQFEISCSKKEIRECFDFDQWNRIMFVTFSADFGAKIRRVILVRNEIVGTGD